MFATPLPAHGDIVVGRDRAGRVLRVSSHPELGRVVLSIWQGGSCLATVRLAPDDVPDLVRVLTAAAVEGGRETGSAAAS
jgi:hypothetical protein